MTKREYLDQLFRILTLLNNRESHHLFLDGDKPGEKDELIIELAELLVRHTVEQGRMPPDPEAIIDELVEMGGLRYA